MRTFQEHEYGKPCPVTGKAIPPNSIYTDHDKPEVFNSCGACGDGLTIGQRLHKLNKQREGPDK